MTLRTPRNKPGSETLRTMETYGFPDPQDHLASLPLMIRLCERAEFPYEYQKRYVIDFFKQCLELSLPCSRKLDDQKLDPAFEPPKLDAFVIDEKSEHFGKACAVLTSYKVQRTVDVVFADRKVVRLRNNQVGGRPYSKKPSQSNDD